MAHDKILKFWMSVPALILLILMASIPITFPLLSKYEGKWLPVVEDIHVHQVAEDEDGIYVAVQFSKVRSCEFLGISWFDEFGRRAPVEFETRESYLPYSRPAERNQMTGPWYLKGIHSLEESSAITSHKCHPFWTTFTNFYP